MKKYLAQGHLASPEDLIAFEFYVLITPKEWIQNALESMISRSQKHYFRALLPYYEKRNDFIPNDPKILFPELLQLPEFKPCNVEFTEKFSPKRVTTPTTNVVPLGLDVEDADDEVLRAFYKNPETYLIEAIENKFYRRRKAFCEHWKTVLMNDSSLTQIPSASNEDVFIQQVAARPDFKLRKDREV